MIKQISAAVIVSFVMAQAVSAQTAPKAEQKTEQSETSKSKPKSKSAETTKDKAKAKDVEAFFKDAEKQMEDGPSCQPPPQPIV